MKWQPIGEYNPEAGRVLVWLEWAHYPSRAGVGHIERSGEPQFAYTMEAGGRAVWVSAENQIPIETTGRSVTHFAVPRQPAQGERSDD